jgi:glycosyltransferase
MEQSRDKGVLGIAARLGGKGFVVSVTISVVTAVYNRVDTIADALASVRSQTWPHVEHVVIDGGSTDGSLSILEACREQFATFVSERDAGIYDALNKGVSRATGDVVGFLHADDLFASPEVLTRVASAFEDPTVDAVFGDLEYVRQDDPSVVVRYWHAGNFEMRSLRLGWMPPHPTFYVRRALYERLGGFDTTYRIAADYDCMLRFLKSGIRVTYIPHLQVKMRVGGASNRSLGNILKKTKEDFRAYRANGGSLMAALFAIFSKNLRKVPQFLLRANVARPVRGTLT